MVGYKTTPISIGEDKIRIGGIMMEEKVNSFTEPILNLSIGDYKIMRGNAIHEYYDKRKSARNLSWFIKRFRWRYLKVMLNGRKNNKKYYSKVVEPLYNKN